MPDQMNPDSTASESEPDAYEQELDDLWQTIQADFTNQSSHQRLHFLAARYLLFDRLARYYADYLVAHPADETATKFRDELVLLTASTLMKRQGNAGTRHGRSSVSKTILVIFGILVLIGGAVFAHHVFKLRTNLITKTYDDALQALARGDLESARDLLVKVREMKPHYRDIDSRLDDVLRSLKMKQEWQKTVPTPKKLPAQPDSSVQSTSADSSSPTPKPDTSGPTDSSPLAARTPQSDEQPREEQPAHTPQQEQKTPTMQPNQTVSHEGLPGVPQNRNMHDE